jgi:hypothetical protein
MASWIRSGFELRIRVHIQFRIRVLTFFYQDFKIFKKKISIFYLLNYLAAWIRIRIFSGLRIPQIRIRKEIFTDPTIQQPLLTNIALKNTKKENKTP